MLEQLLDEAPRFFGYYNLLFLLQAFAGVRADHPPAEHVAAVLGDLVHVEAAVLHFRRGQGVHHDFLHQGIVGEVRTSGAVTRRRSRHHAVLHAPARTRAMHRKRAATFTF